MRKNVKIYSFVTFKELQEKPAFLKIAAQAFEARDFLNIKVLELKNFSY